MPEIEEGSIEILLQRIVFRGFKSKDTIVTLSFVASKKNKTTALCWVVGTEGTTINPLAFFTSYEDAQNELQKRCGTLVLSEKTVCENDKYGQIKGYYNAPPRKDGFIVRHVEVSSSKEENSLGDTVILRGKNNENEE